MQDGISEGWVEGFELTRLDHDSIHAKWARKKMETTIVSHKGNKIGGYEITEVYQVRNSVLWKKYLEQRDRIRKEIGIRVKEIRLFHGTNCAYEITEDGFQAQFSNEKGMFGKGIYFADLSSKCNQYTFGGCNTACKPHGERFCEICERSMLICRVALGNEYEATKAMNGITEPPDGYHSIVANPKQNFLDYREYVIYNNHQAYPGYLVKYRIKK